MQFLLLAAAGILASPAAADDTRPNIVFCFADDWGRHASAYAKHESDPIQAIVRTPNIDAVAKRGVLFRNAFVNAPSCTPCRSSLLSGRYFFNCGRGAILRDAVWDSAIPSYPLLLAESGYTLGKTSKVWSPGAPADAPYGGQKFAFQKAGNRFNNFSESATEAVAGGKTVAQARDALCDEVRGNFDAFLKSRESKQPFAYWFGPTNVHRMWVKGSGKALWGIDPESLKGKLPKFLPDVPEVREDFADYLGEIQAFDAYVGVLMQRLQEAGELERTIVVISGDHGPPGFPGGKCNLYDFGTRVALVAAGPGILGNRVVDDFASLPDLAPTFLDVGKVKHPEKMNAKSLWPVLSSEKSGQVDPERTWVISGRERHVAGARAGNKPYPQRALRTAEFLYVRNYAPDRTPLGDPLAVAADSAPPTDKLENDTMLAFSDMDAGPTKAWLIAHRSDAAWKWHYDYAFAKRPAEELFDLKADPEQIKNVAADPSYATAKAKLAARLKQILVDAGDPRETEADCRFEKPPFSGPSPKAK